MPSPDIPPATQTPPPPPPEDDTTRRHSRHLRLDHHNSYNHTNPTDGWHLLRIYPPARPGIRPTGVIHISPTLHQYDDMGTGTGRHLLGRHVTSHQCHRGRFPESRHMLPQPIKDYHHLSCCNGVAIYKDRIIIPPALRQSCLSTLYAAHQGTSAMTSRAEAAIFWPGITKDIHATRANCTDCNRMAPSQATLPPTQTEYPFQCICADFFHHQGHNYLVIIDRYSNWPIVERARDGAIGLINILRHTFATYGIPDNYPRMEALNSQHMTQERSFGTGAYTTDSARWHSLIATAGLRWVSRQSRGSLLGT